MEQESQKQEPQTTARERAHTARAARNRTGVRERPASPTRSIEAGVVHFRIAEGILRAAQERAKETLGVELDVGEFPSIKESGVESDDPQRIVKLTAHAVARAGDKFKFLRRVSRHLEGKENRAGILSDISAALVALYKRNPKAFESLGQQFYADLRLRRAAQQASSNGGTSPSQPQTRGVTPDVEA